MEKALQTLREEVGALQHEEQEKLEAEKKKALDKLTKQVCPFILNPGCLNLYLKRYHYL